MNRRTFLALAAAAPSAEPTILVHEHVLVDFTGSGKWDSDEAFRVARPRIEEVARLGCRRLLECTPAFLGRDPKLLRRLQDATGVELWTNTGIYGAAGRKYVPPFAIEEPAERLARRWIEEARKGVEGMTPRFIKTGVNHGPLHEVDRKLVRTAAIASRETGLAIAAHAEDGIAALEALQIVLEERVKPDKFVWVHANKEKDHAVHERLAKAGAWVEFDNITAKSAAWHLECVRHMAAAGLLGRTLISQDSGWYRVGEPGGGAFKSFTSIYTDFLPQLERAQARQLMWDNPRRAFGA